MANDTNKYLELIRENYLYMYHCGEDGQWVLLPSYPDTIQDNLGSTFAQTNALSRTAPVFSYSNSGPRQVQVNLTFHRDLFNEVNYAKNSKMKLEVGEDYVDALIRQIQAIALPKYKPNDRGVIPPSIAIRFGDQIFIKGIVNSGIAVTYEKPILEVGVNKEKKYANIQISFTVFETQPYDADSVQELGSFRGITQAFKKGPWNS